MNTNRNISLSRLFLVTALLGVLLTACENGVEGGVSAVESIQAPVLEFSVAHLRQNCVYRRISGEGTLTFQVKDQIPDKPGLEMITLPLNVGATEQQYGQVVEGSGTPGMVSVGQFEGKEIFCPVPEVRSTGGSTLVCRTRQMGSSPSKSECW